MMGLTHLTVLAIVACWSGVARAELRLEGNAPLLGDIQTCLERISGGPPEVQAILRRLNEPAPQGRRNRIRTGRLPRPNPARTTAGQANVGRIQPGGGRGPGTDATITIDPNQVAAMPELCAILMHELAHAADFNDGKDKRTSRPRPRPGAGIPESEIDACREENRFRRHAGLPQRRDWVGIALPPDALF